MLFRVNLLNKNLTYSKIIFFACVLSFSGCAKSAHLHELLAIKSYSDNKDAQEQFIQKQNKNFDRLLETAKTDGLKQYKTKKSFLKEFGPPVFTREVKRQDQPLEMWLYRHATEYFKGSKIYLYFDDQGNLADWELISPEEKT